MKIGIDCRLWNETGVGRYIRNLVLNLQKIDKKNNYILFVLSKDEEGIKHKWKMANDKWKIVRADVRWHTLDEQLKLPQILNRENLDLLHFSYFSVPVFYNRPFVITIHDLILHHFPTGRASTLSPLLYKTKLLAYKFSISYAAERAKKVITVSQATKDEIVDHLGVESDKVVVTYAGADIVKSSRLKVKNLGKYFLYVGNGYPHKNLERLLEAFLSLGEREVKLVFVGKEDYFYKGLKEKVREMKLSRKVIFLENVTDGELVSLYKNAIALTMPSLMEGFGLPALEAMANKCLVLASNIPALREICSDAAIYCDPYNIKDISEKMREILSNDSNLPAGKAGHFTDKIQRGLERSKFFSWKKMAKETLAVYEQAIIP